MTYRVYMLADNIFLSIARNALEQLSDKQNKSNILHGTSVVINSVMAVEAFINKTYIKKTKLKCYDELRLLGKIETLHNLNSSEVNWGGNPYQTFKELVTIRNWLVHFKDPNVGLINSASDWVKDSMNNKPRLDPFEVLKKEHCIRYFNETKKLIVDIGEVSLMPANDYKFAKTEYSEYFSIG